MKRIFVAGVVALCAVFAGSTIASAVVLVAKTPEQKHRKDVGKQIGKLVFCFVKQIDKCEKKGADETSECTIEDPPSSTIADADAKQKFIDGVAKCESKLNLTKKGPASDYTVFGCPGDSDSVTVGDQPYTDLNDFQANVGQDSRDALALLGPNLVTLCQGAPAPFADATECVAHHIKNGGKYAKSIFKCMEKCENDYKGGKGLGGPTDDTDLCNPATSTDPDFLACVGKALAKATKKGPFKALVLSAINGALGDASNDLYNEDDCP